MSTSVSTSTRSPSETFNSKVIYNLDLNQSLVKIFPNPVASEIRIVSESSSLFQKLKVLDFNGKVVFRKTLDDPSSQEKIQLPNLESGIYFVELLNQGTTIGSQKILVR